MSLSIAKNKIRVVIFQLTLAVVYSQFVQAQVLPQVNNGHSKSINCAAFWEDNSIYATGGADYVIKIWDFKTNKVLRSLEGHKYGVYSMASFVADDKKYLISGGIYELKIWDIQKGVVIKNLYAKGSVKCIKMSKDSDSFYYSQDKTIMKYSFSKGYASIFVTGDHDIVGFDFNAKENIFYVAYQSKVEKVSIGDKINRERLNRNTYGDITQIDLDPTDSYLVAAGYNDVVVWDVSLDSVSEPWIIDEANATACFDNTTGKMYARKYQEALIYVYDPKSHALEDSTQNPKYLPTMKIETANLNGLLFGYGFEETLFWETKYYRALREEKNDLSSVEDMSLVGDNLVFGVGLKGKVGVFNLGRGTFQKFNARHNDRVNGIEKIDEDKFIGISYDGTVSLNSIDRKGNYNAFNIEDPADTNFRDKVVFEEGDRLGYVFKNLALKHLFEYEYIADSNTLAASWTNDIEMLNFNQRKWDTPLKGHTDYVKSINLSHNRKYLVSSSLDRTAKLWDLASRTLVHTFEGHTNRVFDAIFSKDDKFVMTGCADGTVRLFDVHSGELIKDVAYKQDEIYDISLNPNGDLLAVAGSNGVKIWDWQHATLSYDLAPAGVQFREVFFINDSLVVAKNRNDNVYFYNIKKGKIGDLIVTDYDDLGFVFFTPDGYYMGDKKSVAANIHFELNNEVYLFEQFDLQYNRPDIILQRLGTADPGYIEILKKAYEKRVRKSGLDPSNMERSKVIDAPKLQIIDAPYYQIVEKPSYILSYKVSDRKSYIQKVTYSVNGVPAPPNDPMKVKSLDLAGKFDITLSKGKNTIEVYATNENGVQSLKERIEVEYRPAKTKKPNLYLITIGASEYEQSEMNLRYAAKDGQDLIGLLTDENQTFNKVNTLAVTNQEVVLGLFDEMNAFLKKAKVDDELIILVSGHGLFDEDYNYYLATYDTDFNNPKGKAISYTLFEKFLGETIIRNKVLFLDACHSGEIDKEEVELAEVASVEEITFRSFGNKTVQNKQSELGLQNSFEVQKELFNDLRENNGTNVISAAAGTEFAMEGADWKNGVFTYAFINGIKSKEADLDGNGRIILSELQEYLQDKVVELTRGKQTPTSRTVNLQNDFVIWEY